MKIPFIFLLIFSIISIINSTYAKHEDSINIISWWGYLSDPILIKNLENDCQTNIEVHEYYTNQEFIYEADQNNYDIYIYSDTSSILTDRKFEHNNIDISFVKETFYPTVKNQQLAINLMDNTSLFALSSTVFFWDNSQIKLSSKTRFDDIIANSLNSTFIFLDDPLEMFTLFKNGYSNKDINIRNFFSYMSKLNMNILFSNDPQHLIGSKHTTMAYTWSGEALYQYSKIKREDPNTKFRYTFHENLSHISYDLLSLNSSSNSAYCVAKKILYGPYHNQIMQDNYYISPTLSKKGITNSDYLSMFDKFISRIHEMPWKAVLSKEDYSTLINLWETFKFNYQ